MSAVGLLVALLGVQCAMAAAVLRLHPPESLARWWPAQALAAGMGLGWGLLHGHWGVAGFSALTLALLFRDWWNRRGRKAARQLGDKSLALLAAVVERLREVAVPVPEGAGA